MEITVNIKPRSKLVFSGFTIKFISAQNALGFI